jgi:hypothetical protein
VPLFATIVAAIPAVGSSAQPCYMSIPYAFVASTKYNTGAFCPYWWIVEIKRRILIMELVKE